MDNTKRQMTKIAREVNKLAVRMMKEEGIGSGEFDLIHLVRHQPGISQRDAGQNLNMDKGAVARRAVRLEQKGYLLRKENPTDGRSRLLYATPKADSLKNSKAAVEAAFYEWLLEELTEDERSRFCETLGKLYLRSKAESRSGFPHIYERLGVLGDGDTAPAKKEGTDGGN